MAIAWFITIYKRRLNRPIPIRYCAMDDYTHLINDDSGEWTESEVLGNYAIVKVRASDTTLNTIASDANVYRVPINSLDRLLGDLTVEQRNALKNRVLSMGYTSEEITTALGSDWSNVTLGQVLRFCASRRLKPRFDESQDEFILDGDIQSCRSIDRVDAKVQ